MDRINKLIQKYGKIDPQRVWNNVKTIEELFYCNIEFIKGNITESFYYFGPLAQDSLPLVGNLIKLNECGVFTHNGQRSISEEKYKHYKTGNDMIAKQRPYIGCYMRRDYEDDLMEYLIALKYPDDEILFTLNRPCYSYTNIDNKEHQLFRKNGETYYPLTKYTDACNKTGEWEYGDMLNVFYYTDEDICDGYAEVQSSIFDHDQMFYGCSDKIFNHFGAHYMSVTITTRKWGSKINIEQVLLDFIALHKNALPKIHPHDVDNVLQLGAKNRDVEKFIETYGKTDPQRIWDGICFQTELFECNIALAVGCIAEPSKNNKHDNYYSILHNAGLYVCSIDKKINRPVLKCYVLPKYFNSLMNYFNKWTYCNDIVIFIASLQKCTYTNIANVDNPSHSTLETDKCLKPGNLRRLKKSNHNVMCKGTSFAYFAISTTQNDSKIVLEDILLNFLYENGHFVDENLKNKVVKSDRMEKFIKKYKNDDHLKIWKCVKTIDELFYCNIEYLKRNINKTFYNPCPLAGDSLPLINGLINLHIAGVFTFSGQSCGDFQCNGKLKSRQRSYLRCFVNKIHLDNIIKSINNTAYNMFPDKIMYIIHFPKTTYTNISHRDGTVKNKGGTFLPASEKMICVNGEKILSPMMFLNVVQKKANHRKYHKKGTYPKMYRTNEFNENIEFVFGRFSKKICSYMHDNYMYVELVTRSWNSTINLEKTLYDYVSH